MAALGMNKKRMAGIAVAVLFLSPIVGCGSISHTFLSPDESVQKEERGTLVPIGNEFDLPILAIHHVGPPPTTASADARVWYISEKTFESILAYIKENDYRPLFISEAIAYINEGVLPEKSIVLTFDDGPADFYTHAWPLLKQYRMPASVSIMTGVRGAGWLSVDQIREIHKDGSVEFHSHTRYHAYLTRISEQEARDELAASKAALDELTGEGMRVVAYPFGLYNDRIIGLAKEAGYAAGLTIRSGREQRRDGLFELRRFIVTDKTDIERLLSR